MIKSGPSSCEMRPILKKGLRFGESLFILPTFTQASTTTLQLLNSVIISTSGSQPCVRVPPGVREKSQGVCQIFISLRITLRFLMKHLISAHHRVCEFIFPTWGCASRKRLGTVAFNQLLTRLFLLEIEI